MSHQHKALGSPCLSDLRRQRVCTMYQGSLISLYLCLQMLIMGARTCHAQGPYKPLVAMLGGEAKLPCFLLPPRNIKNMEIRWTRSLPTQVVHLYEDGRDKPEEAMKEYLGRTELVKNDMHKGIVILKIFSVQFSDSGHYRCAFQNDSLYSDTMIELKVAALGLHPGLHVEVTESQQIQLKCKSKGWFPQPEIQWMDSEGREIPADSKTHTQDKSGLFHVTTSLLLRETSQKNLTCSIWNPVLNQKKEEQLSIAVAKPNRMTIIIMGTALAILTLLTFITTGLLLVNRFKTRHKTRKIQTVCYHQAHQTSCPKLNSQCSNCPILDAKAASCPASSIKVADTNTNCNACHATASKQDSKLKEYKGKGCHALQW